MLPHISHSQIIANASNADASKSTTKAVRLRKKFRKSKPSRISSIRRRSQYFEPDEEDLEELLVPVFFPVEEDNPEWKVITTARVNDEHFVTKYRSRSTGMELVHATVQGPTVHAYITLATRAEDDNGLANILQHMIFMGSEDYPFADTLKLVAGKCLSQGMKPYTAVDHTSYSISTAGCDGLLTMLPICLDHIYFPLLSEAYYFTEIYHINKDCADGGALYDEVNRVNAIPETMAELAFHRAVYDSTSGYHYQHLGFGENFRESADVQKVREYHRRYYNPMNTSITICGQVDPVIIFRDIQPTLDKLILKGRGFKPGSNYYEEWTKPWLAEKLLDSSHQKEITVNYPSSNDEDTCSVFVGFVGPQTLYSTEQVVAVRILMEYLVWGNYSPLYQAFVKSSSPLATFVKFRESSHMKSLFNIQFGGVSLENTDNIVPFLKNVLELELENFDEERMLTVINYCYERDVSQLDVEPYDVIAEAITKDFCYATSDDSLLFDRRVNNTYTIQQFVHQQKTFWIKALSKAVLGQSWVIVKVLPSKEEAVKIQKSEQLRQLERKQRYTEEEQVALGARLEKAFRRKKMQVPVQEILSSIKEPSIRHMGYHIINNLENPEWSNDFKCNLLFDDISSSFVYVTVILDASELNMEQKKYLVLFRNAILQSTVFDDAENRLLTHEEALPILQRDVLAHKLFWGISLDGEMDPDETMFTCGAYAHNLCLTMQLRVQKVEEGFQWIRKLLWNTQWDKIVLKELLQEIIDAGDEMLESGKDMTKAMLNDFLYKHVSPIKATGPVRQRALFKEIDEFYDKKVDDLMKMLDSIRETIVQPQNVTVHIAASLKKMEFQLSNYPQEKLVIYKLLQRAFINFYTDTKNTETVIEKKLSQTADLVNMLNFECIRKWAQELILPMRNKDPLSYLLQATPCVGRYDDPEFARVLLATHYFGQEHGPFWKALIENGLAKSFKFRPLPHTGMIFFELDGCEDIVIAYNAVFDIILSHLREGEVAPVDWNESLLESARSHITFKLISHENTPRNLALQSLHNNFRNVSVDYSRIFVDKLSKLTLGDVELATRKYFRDLFVENISCAVAAPAHKVPAIIKGFTDYSGKRFSLMTDPKQSFLSRW